MYTHNVHPWGVHRIQGLTSDNVHPRGVHWISHMKTVKLDLGPRSYNIYIGERVLEKLPSLIKLKTPNTPLFVVTNRKTNALHGKKLKKALAHLSKKILFCEVPDSEKAKSFPVYIKTIRCLARFARKTRPYVIAFGIYNLNGRSASSQVDVMLAKIQIIFSVPAVKDHLFRRFGCLNVHQLSWKFDPRLAAVDPRSGIFK